MLSLTRKISESVVITHESDPETKIVVEITQLGGGQVKLGIEAPRAYQILRSELGDHMGSKVGS